MNTAEKLSTKISLQELASNPEQVKQYLEQELQIIVDEEDLKSRQNIQNRFNVTTDGLNKLGLLVENKYTYSVESNYTLTVEKK